MFFLIYILKNVNILFLHGIHNNKKHSTTKRIPKDIRDLNDKDEIELIKKEIINELQRKNKYAYVINYENFMF